MAKAISYIRFSAAHQGHGSSIDRQREMIGKWLDSHSDIPLSTLSAEDLGKSAYKGHHLDAGLGTIIKAIETGKIEHGDYLLVEAIDRLGRLQPLEMFELLGRIVKAGVTICTLEDGQEYTIGRINSDAGALFILAGKAQQAYEYSSRLSRRISKANERKRRRARHGEEVKRRNAYWLASDGKLIPEKANLVRFCIDEYLLGRGPRRIVSANIDQYPDLEHIHPRTLMRWYRSRALIGDWETKGEIIKGVFEPLINEATFWSLQERLAYNRKEMSPEETYSLSGLVKCKQCGKRFYFRRKNYKGRTIIYANCSSYLKSNSCKNNKTFQYEVLEFIFEETYQPFLDRLVTSNVNIEATDKLRALSGEIDSMSAQIGNLLAILQAIPDQKETLDRMAELNERREELTSHRQQLESQLTEGNLDTPHLESALHYDALDIDEMYRRDVLKKAGYQIIIDGSDAVVPSTDGEKDRFHLYKRSTKHNCYLLEHATRSGEHFKHAVNWTGWLNTSKGTWEQLLQGLTS